MDLDGEAIERLKDIVELQPTSNSELANKWGYEDSSEAFSYLNSNLDELYYRNEQNKICVTLEGKIEVANQLDEDITELLDSDYFTDREKGIGFERIAELRFKEMGLGYVKRTQAANDGGKDIIVRGEDGRPLLIECKNKDKVGRPDIQKFHSAVVTGSEEALGIIVTTGSLTKPAKDYIDKINSDSIELLHLNFEELEISNLPILKEEMRSDYKVDIREDLLIDELSELFVGPEDIDFEEKNQWRLMVKIDCTNDITKYAEAEIGESDIQNAEITSGRSIGLSSRTDIGELGSTDEKDLTFSRPKLVSEINSSLDELIIDVSTGRFRVDSLYYEFKNDDISVKCKHLGNKIKFDQSSPVECSKCKSESDSFKLIGSYTPFDLCSICERVYCNKCRKKLIFEEGCSGCTDKEPEEAILQRIRKRIVE